MNYFKLETITELETKEVQQITEQFKSTNVNNFLVSNKLYDNYNSNVKDIITLEFDLLLKDNYFGIEYTYRHPMNSKVKYFVTCYFEITPFNKSTLLSFTSKF